jgi:DNA-binding MarR family transcriptional regulator
MASGARSTAAGAGRITWQCGCFNTRKAARAVTRFYDAMLAPSGLKATQLTMLGAVSISGPARMSELAHMLALDKTTLTRNLRLLEADGLIAIAAGADRRARVVSLTRAGADAVERALPRWREAQRRMVEHLGEARWRRLVDDLAELEHLVFQAGLGEDSGILPK